MAEGINTFHCRLLTFWLCMAGGGRRAHVAFCGYPGWAVLRCDAAHGLCGICLRDDLWPCLHYPPCHPAPDHVAVSASLVCATATAAYFPAAACGRGSDGMVARPPVGWIAECVRCAPLLDHPGTGVAAGHIVHKPRVPPKCRLSLPPEALPRHVLAPEEVVVESLQKGIIDGERPNVLRGQNVRFGSFLEDGFKERIATAIAQIDQGCCRWHFLDGLLHIGTMPTMDDHAGSDPPLTQDVIDVGAPLLVLGELIGIDREL